MTVTYTRKFNLLVLDDDPDIVRLVSKLIRDKLSKNIQLVAFTDAIEAKTWLENNCCDILLTDIEMPDVDGLEMLAFAKNRNAWTQVIFLTGNSTCLRITEAIANGASDYLIKPIQPVELVELIKIEINRLGRWHAALARTLQSSTY